MGLNRLKRGYLIQFKRYVDQLTGSSGDKSACPETTGALFFFNLLKIARYRVFKLSSEAW